MTKNERISRQSRGLRSRQQGRSAEWFAALYLMAKGYQILGFRLKTPQAEIDLLARKGKTLAVIEVKRRQSLELALLALKPGQQERLLSAAAHLVRSRPALNCLQPRLDLIALSPRRFPRHLRGLLTASGN